MYLILDLISKYPFEFVNRALLQGLCFPGPKLVAAETAFFILVFLMLLECKCFWEIELLNYKSLQTRDSWISAAHGVTQGKLLQHFTFSFPACELW